MFYLSLEKVFYLMETQNNLILAVKQKSTLCPLLGTVILFMYLFFATDGLTSSSLVSPVQRTLLSCLWPSCFSKVSPSHASHDSYIFALQ